MSVLTLILIVIWVCFFLYYKKIQNKIDLKNRNSFLSQTKKQNKDIDKIEKKSKANVISLGEQS